MKTFKHLNKLFPVLCSFDDLQKSIKLNTHLSKEEFLTNVMDWVQLGTMEKTVSYIYDSYKAELRKERIKKFMEREDNETN